MCETQIFQENTEIYGFIFRMMMEHT